VSVTVAVRMLQLQCGCYSCSEGGYSCSVSVTVAVWMLQLQCECYSCSVSVTVAVRVLQLQCVTRVNVTV